jgi:hypothetical protein
MTEHDQGESVELTTSASVALWILYVLILGKVMQDNTLIV